MKTSMNDHKQDTIQAAIQGLIQGGWDKLYAESLYLLLERVYQSGYYEAYRNIEENPRDWGAY